MNEIDAAILAAFSVPGPIVGQAREDNPIVRHAFWMSRQRSMGPLGMRVFSRQECEEMLSLGLTQPGR